MTIYLLQGFSDVEQRSLTGVEQKNPPRVTRHVFKKSSGGGSIQIIMSVSAALLSRPAAKISKCLPQFKERKAVFE